MKILNGIAFVVVTSSLFNCGLKDSDDDQSRGTAPKDPFTLTGPESSDLDAAAVRSRVNNTPELMKFEPLLKDVRTVVPQIYRGDATTFFACAKNKLDNVPLAVTSDTVSYSFDIDFIAECDEAPKADDRIKEIRNRVKASYSITCAGANLTTAFKDKTFKELNAATCRDARATLVSYNWSVDARKATETKVGSEYEITNVSFIIASKTIAAADGSPCRTVTIDAKTTQLDSCVLINQSKTFNGLPKFEKNSPKEKIDPHPIVTQEKIVLANARMDKDATYYTSAENTFELNGWTGKVEYTNGWSAPKWSAKLGSNEIGGQLSKNKTVAEFPEAAEQPQPTPGDVPVNDTVPPLAPGDADNNGSPNAGVQP